MQEHGGRRRVGAATERESAGFFQRAQLGERAKRCRIVGPDVDPPDVGRRVIYSVARDITRRKQAEEERERLLRDLTTAMAEVQALQTILPICMYCKRVRDDENYWQSVEAFIAQHTHTRFSHAICPECYETMIAPDLKLAKPDS